jgi:predicted transposase/invertase (TIGR01784 family)
MQFNDGEHIIYVNGSIKSNDTALGRLMRDFYCTEAKDMHYKELAERVRHYKETEEGVDKMGSVLDEMRKEVADKAAIDTRIATAKKMIADGLLSLEKIADYSGLSLEKVRELAGNKSA